MDTSSTQRGRNLEDLSLLLGGLRFIAGGLVAAFLVVGAFTSALTSQDPQW